MQVFIGFLVLLHLSMVVAQPSEEKAEAKRKKGSKQNSELEPEKEEHIDPDKLVCDTDHPAKLCCWPKSDLYPARKEKLPNQKACVDCMSHVFSFLPLLLFVRN